LKPSGVIRFSEHISAEGPDVLTDRRNVQDAASYDAKQSAQQKPAKPAAIIVQLAGKGVFDSLPQLI
jgi:hypothetical protein